MRLPATLRNDVLVQYRNGFYWVTLAIVPVFVGILLLLRQADGIDLAPILVAVVSGNIIVTTFYFMAALVLLEKSDGTLSALTVTPLTQGEYLASKAITLASLATAETMLIIAVGYGGPIDYGPLLIGLGLLSLFYVFLGFACVASYDSINKFLPPSIVIVTLIALPLLDHFGVYRSVLWEIHPVQPGLALLRSAFYEDEPMRLRDFAVLTLWTSAAYLWADLSFRRHVVGGGAA